MKTWLSGMSPGGFFSCEMGFSCAAAGSAGNSERPAASNSATGRARAQSRIRAIVMTFSSLGETLLAGDWLQASSICGDRDAQGHAQAGPRIFDVELGAV